jgi:hypothetical protein
MPPRARVPRAYPGATIICAASGPSLTAPDLLACVGLPIVMVNDTYQRVVGAAAIFAADSRWWARMPAARARDTLKYCLTPVWKDGTDGVRVLERTGQTGLEHDPTGLRSGGHSGYAAINLAYHLGASIIVLLGYDMQPAADGTHHWFGGHPDGSHPRYQQWIALYGELTEALAAADVRLVNATRRTAIREVPQVTLREALADVAA